MFSQVIPRLREGIIIQPLDTSYLESTYFIQVGDRQFEISEKYTKMLNLIDGKRSIEDITVELCKTMNRSIASSDVKEMIDNDLVTVGIASYDNIFNEFPKRRQYLHFRIPLIKEKYLSLAASKLQYFFRNNVIIASGFIILLTQVYFYFILDAPLTSVVLITGSDLSIATLLVFISLLFHEMGHISACHYYGAKYQNVGFGLYFYFPAFYSDVTGAWILPRKKRAMVDFGGVYFQLLMVPFFIAFYLFTQRGLIVYVIYIINFSVLSNLNPFIRLDGYWIISDLTGIPNLRKKSIEIVRFYFRILFGSPIKEPFYLNQMRRKILVSLLFYSIISNVFFIFFGFKLFNEFSFAVLSYGTIAQKVVQSFHSSFNDLFSSFIKFMFVNFVLFSFLFFIYRVTFARLFTRLRKKTHV